MTARILPKYVSTFRRGPTPAERARGVTRGPRRWVFRRNGHRIYLPSPADPSFADAVRDAGRASQTEKSGDNPAIGKRYSVAWLVSEYRQTSEFKNLADKTLGDKKSIMRRICSHWGRIDIREITVPTLAQALAGIDSAAVHNRTLSVFKQLFALAVLRGWMQSNPALSAPNKALNSASTHGWTKSERAQFLDFYSDPDCIQRLAFFLLFETVQRSSDVVLMGRGSLDEGEIIGTQVKTGTPFRVPVSDNLAQVLEPVRDQAFFLTDELGRGFKASKFQSLFSSWIRRAGLPDRCRGHGLRTAGCEELAESGCTAPEFMAISGHKTLAVAQGYIQAADKRTLSRNAATKRAKNRE